MARLVQAGLDFATEGERFVAEELQRLPDGWVIIANKVLAMRNGRSFETDFIVVGDQLVFLVDEKGWRGRIHGSETIWVRGDGESIRSPLEKVDYVAKLLAGLLRDRVTGFNELRNHPVQGCVLLSRATERPSVRDSRAKQGVLLLAEAIETMVERDRQDGDPGVKLLRNRIERALVDLTDRPRIPKAFGPYHVLEALPVRAEARRFRARHTEGDERILTVYGPLEDDPALCDFYMQEYRALRELGGIGVAPDCLDPFDWSEDYLVIPSHLPSGDRLSALATPDSEESAQQELRRSAQAFLALSKVHDAKVIHRAIGPEAIAIRETGNELSVQFTDFFAARRGDQTISHYLDERMEDDPFASPEIRSMNTYAFATADSDTFSLALVFLERLAGVSVLNLRKEDDQAIIPEAENSWPYIPQDVADDIAEIFAAALSPGPMAASASPDSSRIMASDIAERLEAIWRGWTRIGQGALLDGRYRIESVLGQGASARTYLAMDTVAEGLFTLKQLRRPNQRGAWSDALREFDVLRRHRHANLPHVYDVYGPENDVHVKLEYIAGTRLTDALPIYINDVERCRRLAEELINVVEHLETHQLLHRDIKPDNIIFDPDTNRTVLIDFGSAVPLGPSVDASGTPGYAPPEAFFGLKDEYPPESTDRYAIAVVLFLALTGQMPFANDSPDQIPITDLSWLPDDARRFAQPLLRAIDPDPTVRYTSAQELRNALASVESSDDRDKDQELEELVNPWVDEIRRLYRNSRLGNSENRGLDTDFARATYVPTALDTNLLPLIFENVPSAVFLTGNPGDGKTAFLAQVEQRLIERNATRAMKDASGWSYKLDGHEYRACYDASEAHDGKSADEQLREKLDGLQECDHPEANLTVLVAINDGRLAEIVDQFEDFGRIASEIERVRFAPEQAAFKRQGVWVIDLKRRCYVALHPTQEDASVMRHMFATMTDPTKWDPVCDACFAQNVCPIRQNAKALGDPEDPDTRTRLEYALLLSHLRSERHITVRDLRSGLSYLLTGDNGCADVHQAHLADQPPLDASFWSNAFTTSDQKDLLLGQLISLDPARRPQPQLERLLFFHQDRATASVRRQLMRGSEDLSRIEDERDWLGQWKRRLYFHSVDPLVIYSNSESSSAPSSISWRQLLPYDHADDFVTALSDKQYRNNLLPRICRGISRSDGMTYSMLGDQLALTVADSESERLTVCKQFPLSDFAVEVQLPIGMNVVEAIPQALVLHHQKSDQHLLITLDLFELLMRLADGLDPRIQELQPLLEDLVPFKNAVKMTETVELTLIEGGERVYRLTQEGRKIVLKQA